MTYRRGPDLSEPSERLLPVRLTPEALERLGGRQPLLDTAEVDRTVGRLYPLYREPEAHHIGQILKRGGAAETAA